jgi:hypothetical protein
MRKTIAFNTKRAFLILKVIVNDFFQRFKTVDNTYFCNYSATTKFARFLRKSLPFFSETYNSLLLIFSIFDTEYSI